MIKILIGTCDEVVYLNEQCFSRIEFDKIRMCVDLYRVVDGVEQRCSKSADYTNVKEVDYINEKGSYHEQYNVKHFIELFD